MTRFCFLFALGINIFENAFKVCTCLAALFSSNKGSVLKDLPRPSILEDISSGFGLENSFYKINSPISRTTQTPRDCHHATIHRDLCSSPRRCSCLSELPPRGQLLWRRLLQPLQFLLRSRSD